MRRTALEVGEPSGAPRLAEGGAAAREQEEVARKRITVEKAHRHGRFRRRCAWRAHYCDPCAPRYPTQVGQASTFVRSR